MKINYIRFRNLFCYGNEMQEIRFDDKDATMWQIIGSNGVGKSSMIRILKLVLYQEYDGVNVSQIANQINKNGYVEANVDSRGHNWTIINEFSPNKVRVYKDGSEEPEDWGKLADTKNEIRNQIVDMPYYIFNNAISLSLDDFKSFLSMNAKDSRNIRDRIFGFYVVNEMMELMKPKMNEYVAKIDKVTAKIENINESIESSQQEYNKLKESINQLNQKEIDRIKSEILENRKHMESYSQEKEELDKKVSDIKLYMEYLRNEARRERLDNMRLDLTNLSKAVEEKEEEKNERKKEKEELDKERKVIASKETLDKIEELSDNINDYEEKSKEIKPERDKIERAIEELEKSIEKFSSVDKLIQNKKVILINVDQLESLNKQHKDVLDSIEKSEGYKEEVNKKLEEGKEKNREKSSIIEELEKRIRAHEQGICSECGTDLTGEEHIKKYQQYEADLELERQKKEKIDEMIQKIVSTQKDVKEKIEKLIRMKHSINSKYSDIKVSISKIEGFDDARDALVYSINHTDHDFIPDWKKTDILDKIESVEISGEDHDIEKDKKELEEKKSLLQQKEKELEEVLQKKNESRARKEALEERIPEDITKEKIQQMELSLDSEEEYNKKISDLEQQIEQYGDSIRNNERETGELKAKIDQLRTELKDDSHFENMADIKVVGDTMDEKINYLDSEISNLNTDINGVSEKVDSIKQKISDDETTIKSLTSDENINNQLKSVKSIIDKFDTELEKYNTDIKENKKYLDFFRVVQYVLSDEGIKSYIMKDVVPSINGEISKILEMLGVPLTVMFDEEFNVHIYRFGEEVSINTISTGQKKMINCAVLLSITIILRMKYQFNVVFYDEILSSVASENRPLLLEIIKNVFPKKLKLHTFVMNHDYIPSSYFDYVVSITHKNNFSSMDVITQDEYESRFISPTKTDKLSKDLLAETSA